MFSLFSRGDKNSKGMEGENKKKRNIHTCEGYGSFLEPDIDTSSTPINTCPQLGSCY